MSERLNSNVAYDVLGDILEILRFRGTVFFHSELAAPWGMSLAQSECPRFHIALAGTCFVGSEENSPIPVQESDIVVVPGGRYHWIADQPGRDLVSSERAQDACELDEPLFQQGAITNKLLCGLVQFDQGARHPLLDALPDVMHFPRQDQNGAIWSIVALIDAELRTSRPGGNRIADRMMEVLFLKLLHQFVAQAEDATGFVAALRDRRVYRALTLIHAEPEFDWTLAALGERVGMSRATLVRRFQDVVGMTPMAYIQDWRIMKAHSLVCHSSASLEQIADATGFASARSLSRTFKRHYGYTPHELRRSRGGLDAAE